MRRSLIAAMLALVVLAWPAHAQLFPTGFPAVEPTTTPAPSAPNGLSELVGGWSGHGRGLTVQGDGRAVYRWRTYSPCDLEPRTPCDGRGEDFYGGKTSITFSRIEGRTVFGDVTETNDPKYFKLGPIRLELRDFGIADLIDQATGVPTPLCGPKYADAPEAVRTMSPCGA